MLPETDGRFAVLAQDEAAGEIDVAGAGTEGGEGVDVVLQDLLPVLRRLGITVELGLEDLIGRPGVRIGGMGVFEVLAAAVEAVGGAEVARLHLVVDVLDVDHPALVQVDARDEGERLLRLGILLLLLLAAVVSHRRLQFGHPAGAVGADPFEFLGEQRQVELGGVEAGEVAAAQQFRDFGNEFDEPRLSDQVLVLDVVHFRGSGSHRDDPVVLQVPRPDPFRPDLWIHALHLRAGKNLDEAEFDDGVGCDVQAGALDVEKEQRPLETQFHTEGCARS